MSRYIDAEVTEQRVREAMVNSPHMIPPLIKFIRSIPTSDTEKVRHGDWDEIRDAYGHIEGWIHRDCGRMSMAKDKYCPNCGAKMDG